MTGVKKPSSPGVEYPRYVLLLLFYFMPVTDS